MRRFLFLSLVLLSSGVFAAPEVSFSDHLCKEGTRPEMLNAATNQSCQCIHRALTALTQHREAVEREFSRGINFSVFFRNPGFYLSRLANRERVCQSGSLRYYCVGYCRTEQQTLAFVKTFLGWVWPTVNVCDEFFDLPASERQDTIAHEMGRLEGIGDSPNFDTNNIYVWDEIVQHLCDEATYQDIIKN